MTKINQSNDVGEHAWIRSIGRTCLMQPHLSPAYKIRYMSGMNQSIPFGYTS